MEQKKNFEKDILVIKGEAHSFKDKNNIKQMPIYREELKNIRERLVKLTAEMKHIHE